MKTILLESALVLALIFIVYRTVFMVLTSKVPAVERDKPFYAHAGICGLPFAFSTWSVLPQLTITLNTFAKSEEWSQPIQHSGALLLLILGIGMTTLVLSYIIFKIISKESSIWAVLKGNSSSASLLLNGIVVCSGIVFSVLAGEIAKSMVPFADVPFNY